jgi:ATP-dependent helicase HepA
LILVPENLAPQWLLECQSRGHFTPLDYAPRAGETGKHVRLAYYEQLKSITEIDPTTYDLLIVDEIHRLQSDARQRIADVAGEFRQLLLLSATPRLDNAHDFRQLLAILEPNRMALAASKSDTPEAVLRNQEFAFSTHTEPGVTEQGTATENVSSIARINSATLATTYSVLRRVTRTRRKDYPGLLPQRELHLIVVEPTSDEVARQEQVWRYISHAATSDSSTDLARLGQVALRSPRALSERINILRGRDQRDPHGFLHEATKHLEFSNGDSRLEALVDLLAEIWNAEPEEAVLVVAEDNPTVDYLDRMLSHLLPEIGPRRHRRALSIAVKRNRDTSATTDLVDLFGEFDDSLGGFVNGDAQLLIAADLANVGLNLQHASKLIFFSVPWSPLTVEQWIGRVDRLGSVALENRLGEKTVDVFAICQRGQVDERVVSILNDFAIFERSIRLDGEEIKAVSQKIVDAALASSTTNWRALSDEIREAANNNIDALETPLSAALPWRLAQTRVLADYFDEFGTVGPVLERSDSRKAFVRNEVALRGWMRLLKRANGLRLWKGEDRLDSSRKFRLLHYFRPAFSSAPIEPRFALPNLDPDDGQRYAYLDSRRALELPPVITVNVDSNPATPLNFLDHGDPVHDALVREWKKIGTRTPRHLEVRFPDGHCLANDTERGIYLIRVYSWIPGDIYFADLDRLPLLKRLEEARTRQDQKPLLDAIPQMEEDLRADRFWLNSILTPRLDVLAVRYTNEAWELVDPTVADALFIPWCSTVKGKNVILARGEETSPNVQMKARESRGLAMLESESCERHRRKFTATMGLEALIAARRYLVNQEANDLIALRQAQLDEAHSLGMETSEHGFTRSRFRTIQNARDMAIYARDIRLARIDGLALALSKPNYNEYKLLTLKVE